MNSSHFGPQQLGSKHLDGVSLPQLLKPAVWSNNGLSRLPALLPLLKFLNSDYLFSALRPQAEVYDEMKVDKIQELEKITNISFRQL